MSIESHVTFKGKVPKDVFYQVTEKIDVMKSMGYVFSKHERKDSDEFIEFDFELKLSNSHDTKRNI